MENSKLSFVAPYLVLGGILYFIAVVIYRLYFSPLARCPGSKLTAATRWIETNYDVFKGGQFIFRLKRWHDQYGGYKPAGWNI